MLPISFKPLLCFGIALTATIPATATFVTYPNFSSSAGLTFIGNAGTAVTADGAVLRVTGAAGGESGAAYLSTPFTLGPSDIFSTQFQFRFTQPGGWDPADGITFVLAANPTGLGSGGVGMGYSGVPNSVAIEFDTYNNAGYGLGNNDGNSSNHISIDTDGILTNTAITNVYGNGSCGFPGGYPGQNSYTAPGCMSNGKVWTAKVGYNGSTLSVQVQDPSEPAPFVALNNYPINLAGFLGTNTAYVGFTSGTGSGWENHDILNWSLADTPTLPSNPSPEPGSIALLSTGILGIGFAIRSSRAKRSAK